MTSAVLYQLWSIPTQSANDVISSAPHDPNVFTVNDALLNRWAAHDLAYTLTLVLESEAHLRSEALIPFYRCIRERRNALKTILQKKGLTTIYEAMLPYLEKLMQDYLLYTAKTTCLEDYHWSSLVAKHSVVTDIFFDSYDSVKNPADQQFSLKNYVEHIMGEETLGLYMAEFVEDRFGVCLRVLREEVMRIRESTETGWREEEAKELTMGFRNVEALVFALFF
ncbi:hypothetical protein BDD12DRAFT_877066 [Trichophaea hybrida]|nr:hypothetical protein BDD12DRAFT_877066 [Trichophaea hybrida]